MQDNVHVLFFELYVCLNSEYFYSICHRHGNGLCHYWGRFMCKPPSSIPPYMTSSACRALTLEGRAASANPSSIGRALALLGRGPEFKTYLDR